MLAYRLTGWQAPPALVEVPVPSPGPGQVVVRVAACGLCHSDLSMMAMPASMGEALGWKIPFTLGHETAGWVHAVGSGVTDLETDQPVAVASPSSCGRCRRCRAGRDNTCVDGLAGRGYGRDGGLAGYLLVDHTRSLFALGSLEPAVAAPLTDAGATSHHAVARVLPRLPDDGVALVIGAGGLGAFVVQILRARSSATIVVADPDPLRRAVAARLGADHVLDGVDGSTAAALRELVGADGVDVIVDLVGTDETIATSMEVLSAGGAYGLVGAAGGTLRRRWYATLPRDGEVFTFQGSDLADARAVLALAERGQVRVETVPYRLDQVEMAYEALRAGGLAGRITVAP
jgi:propanol-preferring alcohol dehydrogenase